MLIRQDTAVSALPGNFAHVIFSIARWKGKPELLVSAQSPPLINAACIPLIKLLAQQYLPLSFYLLAGLNCGLCRVSLVLRAPPAPWKDRLPFIISEMERCWCVWNKAERGGYWMPDLNTAVFQSQPSWCILGCRFMAFFSPPLDSPHAPTPFLGFYVLYIHRHTNNYQRNVFHQCEGIGQGHLPSCMQCELLNPCCLRVLLPFKCRHNQSSHVVWLYMYHLLLSSFSGHLVIISNLFSPIMSLLGVPDWKLIKRGYIWFGWNM